MSTSHSSQIRQLAGGSQLSRMAGGSRMRPMARTNGDIRRRVWIVSARRYAVVTLACALFSFVYETLSHGVVSVWMVFMFAYPLVLGVLPAIVAYMASVRESYAGRQLWASGVATLAIGSCLRGVLEIYGTTSALVAPYPLVGVALLVLGGLLAVRAAL